MHYNGNNSKEIETITCYHRTVTTPHMPHMNQTVPNEPLRRYYWFQILTLCLTHTLFMKDEYNFMATNPVLFSQNLPFNEFTILKAGLHIQHTWAFLKT